MLEYVDRVQLVVRERQVASERFAALLDAVVIREDAVAPLAAMRTSLRAGAAVFELLEPDGTGPLATHLERWGPGLFAAGFAVRDLAAFRSRLLARHVSFAEADGQLFLDAAATGDHGLPCVVSAYSDDLPPRGLANSSLPSAGARARRGGAPQSAVCEAPALIADLYEVTNLVRDHAAAVGGYTDVFGLAADRYCAIESTQYGYRGVLTMFAPEDRLDRIECITPYDTGKTMGRFMERRGEGLYMAFAEAPDLAPIRVRLERECPHDWTGVPGRTGLDTIFLHPRALGGLMLGISRVSVAWSWSGQPDRVA